MMRLACGNCDRTDGDGVPAAPDGWVDVDVAAVDVGVGTWWDHLGTCPDCHRDEVISAFFRLALSMRRHNTDEWMQLFTARCNEYLAVHDMHDCRVEYDGDLLQLHWRHSGDPQS